jgi:hypothetical protein
MKRYFSTGQSSQRAVAPTEEEAEEKEVLRQYQPILPPSVSVTGQITSNNSL